MRLLRRVLVVLILSILLVTSGSEDLKLSPLELAAAPYRYDIVTWELTHFPDKWFHKLKSHLPWSSTSEEERLENVQEFFRIGTEIRALDNQISSLQLRSNNIDTGANPAIEAARLSGDAEELTKRRSSLRAGVEETLESVISAVIGEEGLDSRIGLIFPPVDLALENPPRLLIVSPRDAIHRQQTILLKPGISVEEMEALEQTILELEDLAALVEGIGGVATYPSIVNQGSGLRGAAITGTHEWLHTYWFFRPLGWNFWSSSEMTTLNETAASLAGRELGLRVYSAITGEAVEEPRVDSVTPPRGAFPTPEPESIEEEGFNFRLEMHTTRLRADELLAEGRIEAAEEYMESRRLIFVENGFLIRKLNQAYFAFHGTYASSPASVSPIGREVEQLRSLTDSVGDFIRTMSSFGSYQEFKGFLTSDGEGTSTARLEPARAG